MERTIYNWLEQILLSTDNAKFFLSVENTLITSWPNYKFRFAITESNVPSGYWWL